MIIWTLALDIILASVITTMSFQAPTPESAQFTSPKFARLLRQRARKFSDQVPTVSLINFPANSPTHSPATHPTLSGGVSGEASGDKRGPSSIGSLGRFEPIGLKNSTAPNVLNSDIDAKNDAGSVDVSLNCQSTERAQFVNSVAQIRLIGTTCKTNIDISATEIRNLSNGASATLFYPTPKTYSSDYIALTLGENKLHVSHLFKDGSREEHEYVFERKIRPRQED